MARPIIAAACVLDGQIWTLPAPARHHHILQAIDRVLPGRAIEVHPEQQGFIDSTWNYVGRKEAGERAVACGQVGALKWPPYLYSEDLW